MHFGIFLAKISATKNRKLVEKRWHRFSKINFASRIHGKGESVAACVRNYTFAVRSHPSTAVEKCLCIQNPDSGGKSLGLLLQEIL